VSISFSRRTQVHGISMNIEEIKRAKHNWTKEIKNLTWGDTG
jgi:hypothetical protein